MPVLSWESLVFLNIFNSQNIKELELKVLRFPKSFKKPELEVFLISKIKKKPGTKSKSHPILVDSQIWLNLPMGTKMKWFLRVWNNFILGFFFLIYWFCHIWKDFCENHGLNSPDFYPQKKGLNSPDFYKKFQLVPRI